MQLRNGLHVRGRARFEGAASATPPRFGLYIESADGAAPANLTLQTSQVDAQGTFVTTGRRPGSYLLRVMVSAASSSRGWFFKGAMLGGRDISVVPVDLRDADVDDVVLIFSDRPNAEISGVVVNAICPGAKSAAFKRIMAEHPELEAAADASNPMGRIGDPEEDIAPVALFLASEDCRYVTGNTLYADGGGHINGVAWAPDLEEQ